MVFTEQWYSYTYVSFSAAAGDTKESARCEEDNKLGLAVGLMFLLTLLLTALLAVIAGVAAVAADRRCREKKAPEQIPANTTTQNAYGTQE